MFDKLSIQDIIATRHVKRWHMVKVKSQQNIAEHSYLTTLIAVKLAGTFIDPLTLSERVDVFEGAILHDIAETQFGDIPTPTKKFLGDNGLSKILEFIECAFWNGRGSKSLPLGNSTNRVKGIVRLADMLEAAIFYSEEGEDMAIKSRLRRDALVFAKENFPTEPVLLSEVDRYLSN